MPCPIDDNSSDAFIYNNILNPLSKHICFIHPNYVTITNMIIIIPLVYGILYKWSFPTFITLIFVRAVLDCLDGSIARTCKTTSELGALLDRLGDSLALLSIATSLVYLIYLKYGKKSYMYIILFMLFVLSNVMYVNYKLDNKEKLTGIYKCFHDNYIVFNVAFGSLLWGFIHSYL